MNTQKFRKFSLLAAALIAVGLVGCGGGSNSTDDTVAAADDSGEVIPYYRTIDSRKAGVTAAWVGTGIGKTVSPADVRRHYNMPAALDGAGQTIAIVVAPSTGDPAADLNYFSKYYNLPECNTANPCFERIDLSKGKIPTARMDWAVEVALDIQWAHVVAPAAKIVLVTAKTIMLTDMMSAVKVASQIPGVVAVSMSWGGKDQLEVNARSLDKVFAANTGVVYLAATGDFGNNGKNQTYPSTSTYVTAVGGTKLMGGNTVENPSTEVAWRLGGGGASLYTAMPTYQTNYLASSPVYALSNGKRTVPDVSYNADMNASPVGVRVNGVWRAVGGTSAGTPQWAGIVALLAQNMQNKGQSFSTYVRGNNGFNPLLYQAKIQSSFNDVTSGSNWTGSRSLTCALCSAGSGYDAATGLGAPNVGNLLTYF